MVSSMSETILIPRVGIRQILPEAVNSLSCLGRLLELETKILYSIVPESAPGNDWTRRSSNKNLCSNRPVRLGFFSKSNCWSPILTEMRGRGLHLVMNGVTRSPNNLLAISSSVACMTPPSMRIIIFWRRLKTTGDFHATPETPTLQRPSGN